MRNISLFFIHHFLGKLAVDLVQLVKDLQSGIKYEVKRDEFEPDYGYVNVTIGNVSYMHFKIYFESHRAILINSTINMSS